MLFKLKYMKKSVSQRFVIGKGRSHFIAFSDNCAFSSLILHRTQTGGFLKVSNNVKSDIILMNVLHSVLLKSNGLSSTLSGFFYACMIFHWHALEDIG